MDIEVNINNVEYIYLNHNYLVSKNDKLSKLRQSRKQIIVSSILPKNKRNSLSWVKKMLRISEFRSFFGRIRRPQNAFEVTDLYLAHLYNFRYK